MPYTNPEDKKKQMKKWSERVIAQGYGKWLYQRRKLRFEDADRFRKALEYIVDTGTSDPRSAMVHMQEIAREALRASAYAEAELGHFHGQNFGESDADLP